MTLLAARALVGQQANIRSCRRDRHQPSSLHRTPVWRYESPEPRFCGKSERGMATLPDYQTLMLPLLRVAQDGSPLAVRDAIQRLAREFDLSDEQRNSDRIRSGQPRFDNRVWWARKYLGAALLLEPAGRGTVRITQRGLDVLKEQPTRIDNRFLAHFPEFQEWRGRSSDPEPPEPIPTEPQPGTPEESLEASYQTLRAQLAKDILGRIRTCSPLFFERLVVDLLVSMGYGGSQKDAARAVGRTGDDGIDGIIKEDKLGLDVVYIQAKRWEATVGRPQIQAFAGSLEGHRARKGVFITTSRFSHDALEYVDRIEKKIVLIDGDTLVQLMIDHGIGVTEAASYVVKKVDTDYFEEGE